MECPWLWQGHRGILQTKQAGNTSCLSGAGSASALLLTSVSGWNSHGRAAWEQTLARMSKLGPWTVTLSVVGGGQSTLSWARTIQGLCQLPWIDEKITDKLVRKENVSPLHRKLSSATQNYPPCPLRLISILLYQMSPLAAKLGLVASSCHLSGLFSEMFNIPMYKWVTLDLAKQGDISNAWGL